MELYVCSIESEKCMFGECSQCPNENFRNEIEKFEAFQNAVEIIKNVGFQQIDLL